MSLRELHFAHPLWLWGNLVVPLVWGVFYLFYRTRSPIHQLEKFVDSHLLPYLLISKSNKERSFLKTLLVWSVVWVCLTLALAGPRWSFREMETFSKDQSLVILLDLSESMNATDVKPSRLVRAKQKIEDFINLSSGVKIGLIAFAADPHMIAPVTDDKEMIRHLLPSLETDLVYVQGSKLSVALDMAASMLEAEPGNNKALLVISDGGFEDVSFIGTAKKLIEKGLVIHSMGIGSSSGAPLKDHQGNVIKKNGTPILSRLEKEKLIGLSEAGNGHYLEGHYSDHDEVMILKELKNRAEDQVNIGKKSQLWDERFYLVILPILPIILWWFRRGYVFSILFVFSLPIFGLEAKSSQDYFKNSEELGKQAMDAGDYEAAIQKFKDPYRAGVAYYRAGNFSEAEKMFLKSSREEVSSNAIYNLGNSLAKQQKIKEAISVYEEFLKKWPDNTKAKENLELLKKMLEDQKEDSSKEDSSDQKEESDEGESKEGDSKEGDESKSSDAEDKDKDKDQDLDKPEPDEMPNPEEQSDEKPEAKEPKSQEDQDADVWLNQISNDPKTFLKNKFYIESKKNGTSEGVDPW